MMKNLKLNPLSLVFLTAFYFSSSGFAAEVVGQGGTGAKAQNLPASPSSGSKLTADEIKNGGVESPYPSCSGYLMVESSKYQKNQTYWKERMSSCDAKVANCNLTVQTIPDSGLLASRSVVPGQNMSSAVTVGAFLNSVRERAITELTQKSQALESLQTSCKGASGGTCDAALGKIRSNVTAELPSFRSSIAMMKTPSEQELQRAVVTNDVTALINKSLELSTFEGRVPKMVPLSDKEVDAAKKEYEALFAKARKEFAAETEELLAPLKVKGREADLVRQRSLLSRAENFTVKLKEVLLKDRTEKATRYLASLTKVPELGYIGDGKASRSVAAAGLGAMVDDLKSRLKDMKANSVSAKDLTSAKVSGDALQYAAYSRLIDKMLAEEQAAGKSSSCVVATAAFNQLKTLEGRNAGLATAAIVGASVGFAVAPWAAGAMGAGMSAGAAAVSANLAIASGIIGGVGLTASDMASAADTTQLARVGLATEKDAAEARSSAAVGALLSPLDFMGGGALVGAGAAVCAKALSRFSAASVAKGQLKTAAVNAEDVSKLAATAAVGLAAKSGKAVAKEEVLKAAEAQAKLEALGDKSAASLLGRPVVVHDEKSFESLAKAGLLGSADKPNFAVAQQYASITQKMAPDAQAKFAKDLETVTNAIASKAKSPTATVAKDLADPARNEVAGKFVLELAASGAPDKVGTAALAAPGSGFSGASLQGVLEVMSAAKRLVTGAGEVAGGKMAKAYREAIAKLSGKRGKDVDQMCICSKLCPAGAIGFNDTFQFDKTMDGPYKDLVADVDASTEGPSGASVNVSEESIIGSMVRATFRSSVTPFRSIASIEAASTCVAN